MVTSWKGDAMLSEFHMFPNAEKVLLEFLASGKHPLVKRSEGTISGPSAKTIACTF